jgi:ribosomal RNA-processing protein 17
LQIRQQRKEDLEKHVSEVNMLLRRAAGEATDVEDSSESEFEGFPDPVIPEEVNREEEYIDEDKYTTVTIESVGISKDGFEKPGEKKEVVEGPKKEKRVWTKEKPKSARPTVKKKKFRYESPADRKAARQKIGAKNRAAAAARKGDT